MKVKYAIIYNLLLMGDRDTLQLQSSLLIHRIFQNYYELIAIVLLAESIKTQLFIAHHYIGCNGIDEMLGLLIYIESS